MYTFWPLILCQFFHAINAGGGGDGLKGIVKIYIFFIYTVIFKAF